jgi:AbrB family looped-hinge helix DNA binding protein
MTETHLSNLTLLTSKMKTSPLEIRSATITEKGQISIPKDMRTRRFKEGQRVAILAFEDRIEILPLQDLLKKLEPALLSQEALSKDWLSPEERKAWKHL